MGERLSEDERKAMEGEEMRSRREVEEWEKGI
jgi:hypothetical protein